MDVRPRNARYVFDRFELRPAERRLLADGVVQRLTPRAFNLLSALVERPGELCSKDDLLSRVWPGLVVEENNLQVQVSALRKILQHDAIETVAGYGYRFTLDVAQRDAEPPEPSQRRHNLPHALSRFVGRSREIGECAELLAGTRLLTLTGVGGIGKSRLALQLAEKQLEDFADGVWLAEFAALSDPRLVTQAIASILGVREQPGQALLDALAEHVRDRRMLLVFDNCEHLAHECAHVAKRLLQAGERIAMLATSREPLHVAGETTYAVPSLTVPTLRPDLSAADASGADAVCLFVDRAIAVQREFALTQASAAAVAEICVRLDGIPLAIELAAARARVLSAEGIAQRLDDRFRLLKAADRTAPERQQTLRATIDWSYDALAPQEKALLARLAVFPGGWSLEAAEDVGAASDIERWEILDLHGNLVEKSLVTADGDGRYRLLETVRMYAQERLDASGEDAATRTRHLAHFVAFVESGPKEPGPDEEAWVARLDAERENLRAAYQWAAGDGSDPARALRVVSPIGFWLCMNYFDLGTPILADMLARPEVRERNAVRFHGIAAAGFLSYHRGRDADAHRYAEEALAIARELGSELLTATALTQLGDASHGLGARTEARSHLEAAVSCARRAGDKGVVLWAALNQLAEVLSADGEQAAAASLYEECLAIARELRSRNLTTVSLLNLARTSLSTGAAVRAGELMRQALVVFEDMGADRGLHGLLAFSAGIAALREEWEQTARLFGASERELARMGMRREPADAAALATLLAAAARGCGNEAFAAAEAAGRALGRAEATAELRHWLEKLG